MGLSCCGLEKAEANNISTKELCIRVIKKWELVYPCPIHPSGQLMHLGQGPCDREVLDTELSTIPQEPLIHLSAQVPPLCAQGSEVQRLGS
jgi:hypothetical protein